MVCAALLLATKESNATKARARTLTSLFVVVLGVVVAWKLFFILRIGVKNTIPPKLLNLQDLVNKEQIEELKPVFGDAGFDPDDAYHVGRKAAQEAWSMTYFWVSLRLSSFFIGVLGYLATVDGNMLSNVRKVLGRMSLFIGLSLLLFVMHFQAQSSYPETTFSSFPLYDHLFREIHCIGLVLLIWGMIAWPENVITKILSARIFAKLSQYTYLVYLLHPFLAALVWMSPPTEVSAIAVVVNFVKLYVMTLMVVFPLSYVEAYTFRLVIRPLVSLIEPKAQQKKD